MIRIHPLALILIKLNKMNINHEGARFIVICKRCKRKFEVIRNWGGGIRRESSGVHPDGNPAICHCGSRQLELF